MNSEPSVWQLDVFSLCREHARKSGTLPIRLLTRMGDDLAQQEGSLHYELAGSLDDEKRALLNIRIQGNLLMRCQRCLEPLTYAVDVDDTLQLVHSEEELGSEEDELTAVMEGNADIEKIVGSKHLDTLNLLEDEIILSLPIVIAHEACPKTLPTSAGEKVSAFDVLRTLKEK